MLRIRAALIREQGMVVNKKLILSIIRELGIKGLPGPKRRTKNLVEQATEEDLVQRNFTVDRPNVLWLTDITEHPTREGKVCCCVGPRRLQSSRGGLGHRPAVRARAGERRRHRWPGNHDRQDGVIIHSDHGSQYTSWGFSELVRTKA